MRLPALAFAGALLAGAAAAEDMQAPPVTLSDVNWAEAAASLPERGIDPPAAAFARLNALTAKRFPGIAASSVPVLLPIDIERLREDDAAGKPDLATSDGYFGPFRPSKFFLSGPAGYTATFMLNNGDGGLDFTFRKPVEIEITGAAFTYDRDGPQHEEVFPAHDLETSFPGIKRILHEAHVRYAFERFGVPYVVSIQCYDRPRAHRYLSCKEADPIAARFLHMLRTAGGSPLAVKPPRVDLARPAEKSPDFSFFSPGDLIPGTGWHKLPGRADYHVYADMRFPMADAPAYIKSQSFMPWGDCYRTGRNNPTRTKGGEYSCKVNGLPLVFDESAAVNFTYPWRDNFCEMRDFLVGQCLGGHGHQGEDIRPATCVLREPNADRCLPYQHAVAAVRSGMIWRNAGNIGVYIAVNTANDLVRFRYLHMNPKFMDNDGLFSGRLVSEGETIGKVANWGDYPSGTSYHIHFNIQVFTRIGWVWVNPYMTLVLAYEKMIGAHGTEIKDGDPVPPTPIKPPVIAGPTPEASAAIPLPLARPQQKTEESTADRNKRRQVHRHARRQG